MKLLAALALLMMFPLSAMAQEKTTRTAYFAGGCFWCMESEFEDLKGVSDVVSGYAGGPKREKAPTYEEVGTGRSGYVEAVAVTYDPAAVTYDQLLKIFWRNVDPFDPDGQFCDKGAQYAAAIFTATPEENKLAQESLKKVEEKFGKKVATKIVPHTTFYAAEAYHQDYSKNNAIRYNLYKNGCGRPQTLKKLWGGEEKKD